jgi:outer membrane murein-binding lipoprotein Lpp
MRIVCLCMVIGLLVSGCTTTGKVDRMIDESTASQFEQVDARFDAQQVAATATLDDLKEFVDRLGRRLDIDVKELQSDANGLDTKISSLENSSGDIQEGVDSAKADLVKLTGSIKSVSAKVDTLNAGAKELKAFDVKQLAAQKKLTDDIAAAAAVVATPQGLFHKHNK